MKPGSNLAVMLRGWRTAFHVLSFILVTPASVFCQNQPVPLKLQSLEYPPVALQANVQGQVTLDCTVGTDGRVISVQPTAGQVVLANAAAANVQLWTFSQAIDYATTRTITLVFEFRINGVTAGRAVSTAVIYYPNRVVVSAPRPAILGTL